jgi:hypothetical protein
MTWVSREFLEGPIAKQLPVTSILCSRAPTWTIMYLSRQFFTTCLQALLIISSVFVITTFSSLHIQNIRTTNHPLPNTTRHILLNYNILLPSTVQSPSSGIPQTYLDSQIIRESVFIEDQNAIPKKYQQDRDDTGSYFWVLYS